MATAATSIDADANGCGASEPITGPFAIVSGDKGLATCAGGQLDVHGVGPVQTGGT